MRQAQILRVLLLGLTLAGLAGGGCRRYELTEAEGTAMTATNLPPLDFSAGLPPDKLAGDLRLMGHRNWVVVADSAYPAQSSPGVETVYVGGSQIEMVKAVLEALDGAKHVKPVVHLDAELKHVTESLAPGIAAYREQLDKLLQNRRLSVMPHDELIARLNEASKVFRVLILKTDLTLPYTSVFFELDCGYWSPEREQQLRQTMGAKP
jgi:L-fucose mutarotase/ribose pyranase (RbsD/FucU family)